MKDQKEYFEHEFFKVNKVNKIINNIYNKSGKKQIIKIKINLTKYSFTNSSKSSTNNNGSTQ